MKTRRENSLEISKINSIYFSKFSCFHYFHLPFLRQNWHTFKWNIPSPRTEILEYWYTYQHSKSSVDTNDPPQQINTKINMCVSVCFNDCNHPTIIHCFGYIPQFSIVLNWIFHSSFLYQSRFSWTKIMLDSAIQKKPSLLLWCNFHLDYFELYKSLIHCDLYPWCFFFSEMLSFQQSETFSWWVKYCYQ